MRVAQTGAEGGDCRSARYLTDLGMLDAPPEDGFDALTRLAKRLFETPVALVSIIDEANDRQYFKSQQGLAEPWQSRRQTPLSHSFCKHVKARNEVLTVPASRRHALVCDNPAIEVLDVAAYLGAPIHAPDGRPLGALCVIDGQPRDWSEDQIVLLQDLAGCATDEIKLRATLRENAALIGRLEAARKRLDRYNSMRESIVMAFMAPDLSGEDRFAALLKAACDALCADHGGIARVAGNEAEILFRVPVPGRSAQPERRAAGGSLFAEVVRGQGLVSCADTAGTSYDGLRSLLGSRPGHFLAAPIVAEGRLFGVLEFSGLRPRQADWTEEDKSIISIVAMFTAAHLALYGQIDGLKRSEAALLDQLLAAKATMRVAG